jgi:hypothetical protein
VLRGRVALAISASATCAVLLWMVLPSPWGVGVLESQPKSAGGSWAGQNVQFPLETGSDKPDNCVFVNSTVNTDRFCLSLIPGGGGYELNGTFDHGPFTESDPVYMSEGPPCASSCPSSATWTSPDGTGRIWWGFTTNATLYALD